MVMRKEASAAEKREGTVVPHLVDGMYRNTVAE